jgi:hypothetical protein
MKRRSLLTAAGLAVVSLAGCSTMAGDAVVNAARRSPSGRSDRVSYNDLPPAQKRIARTAVEQDFYHACPELPDALRSFADRFRTTTDSYLRYRNTTYGVWIRIEDTLRVTTAPSPEQDRSCGLL